MSIFTGKQHKGAMREHLAKKRSQAESRSSRPLSVVPGCGHSTALHFDDHRELCGEVSS